MQDKCKKVAIDATTTCMSPQSTPNIKTQGSKYTLATSFICRKSSEIRKLFPNSATKMHIYPKTHFGPNVQICKKMTLHE